MQNPREQKDSYLRIMESIPTQGYIGAALGSIALSAFFRILGKKDAAVFVGQWPPTFLLLALTHRLLQPSQESGEQEARDALHEATRMTGGRG